MTKRDRIDALKARIRAGGAAHYYDPDEYGEQYAGDTVSDADADVLLDLHDYSDGRHTYKKMMKYIQDVRGTEVYR